MTTADPADQPLQATATIPNVQTVDPNDLELHVTITNTSARPVRFNALHLPYTTIMMRVVYPDGTRVAPGPPPLPPRDDGEVGRVTLAPGDRLQYLYRGGDCFSSRLTPGHYRVRFEHENADDHHGDWTGRLETPWIPFEVLAP